SLEDQAAFAARQQLFNLSQGVPLSIWYDWKNDGPDRNENEHNFGLVYEDLKPKPSYVALRTLTHELADYRFTRRLAQADEADYVFLFSNAKGGHYLAAWTVSKPHSVSLPIHLKKVREPAGVLSNGQKFPLKIEKDLLTLELT